MFLPTEQLIEYNAAVLGENANVSLFNENTPTHLKGYRAMLLTFLRPLLVLLRILCRMPLRFAVGIVWSACFLVVLIHVLFDTSFRAILSMIDKVYVLEILVFAGTIFGFLLLLARGIKTCFWTVKESWQEIKTELKSTTELRDVLYNSTKDLLGNWVSVASLLFLTSCLIIGLFASKDTERRVFESLVDLHVNRHYEKYPDCQEHESVLADAIQLTKHHLVNQEYIEKRFWRKFRWASDEDVMNSNSELYKLYGKTIQELPSQPKPTHTH